MAELAKKLHFLKDGTEQTAKAYSTVDEAGDNYVNGKIDSVACYAPIGDTDDAMATNGRVTKGGSTYAIKSQSKLPYTEISYTTAGTHTFTVPAGITRLRVAVCGGGAGGVCHEYNSVGTGSYGGTYYGYGGGVSKFGELLTATGASRSYVQGVRGEELDSDWYAYSSYPYTGNPGSPNGNAGKTFGNKSSASRASGFELSFMKTSGSYGKGGDGVAATHWGVGSSGSSGGYDTAYVDVSAGTTYSVIVGAGGDGAASSSNYTATAGNSGFVLIAYGGDI